MGLEQHDAEGRIITIEFEQFIYVCVYTPNSGEKLTRLIYRTEYWDFAFNEHVRKLGLKGKPVIL